MKIAIGCDHAGIDVKNALINKIKEKNMEYIDCGTYERTSCDYPVYAFKVANEVKDKNADFGIVICGTGIGISIAANKVKGIRCALIYSESTARLCKQHNNANVIAFGAREFSIETILKFFDIYMNTEFENRHQKRLDLINDYEIGCA